MVEFTMIRDRAVFSFGTEGMRGDQQSANCNFTFPKRDN